MSINIAYVFDIIMSKEVDQDETEGEGEVRISLLLEKQLLDGVDRASGRFGLTRSAFVRQACMKALQEVQDEPDWGDLIESTRNMFYYDLNGLAKRLLYVSYISPEGLRILQQKISDQVGPAELLQGIPSPFEQLLRKLGVTKKRAKEALTRKETLRLKVV